MTIVGQSKARTPRPCKLLTGAFDALQTLIRASYVVSLSLVFRMPRVMKCPALGRNEKSDDCRIESSNCSFSTMRLPTTLVAHLRVTWRVSV
jgi:hypothetical protein